MRFEIAGYRAAGPIAFGMSRDEVRAGLRAEATPFHKAAGDEEESDQFPALGIVVYYEPPGRCEAVEFGGGAAEPLFAGRSLLGMPYPDVLDWWGGLDPACYERSGVVIAPRLGVSVWAPAGAARVVKSALAFKRGYWHDP